MTWVTRCISLLSDVRHTQRPELLAEALESASELRQIISASAHLDELAKQSHLVSIDATAAELWFRKRDFEELLPVISEVFAKTVLSPTCNLQLDGLPSLAAECLEKALELYPSADTEAHVRTSTPDAFKSHINPVIRLVTLFIDDHGDRFLAAWEQDRDGLGDAFLQEFFDATGLEQFEMVRDARSLMITVAEIDIFEAQGKVHRVEASLNGANLLAQKINSQAAAFVCERSGQIKMRCGHLNFAREELSRAFTLFADQDPDRRRECAVLLAFCNYFQVCRVKYRVEDDVEANLSEDEKMKLQELAAALRRADAAGFAALLQEDCFLLGSFLRELLTSVSKS
ncbi:hypothetical protein AAVH_20285 [Aphelenchoides avenae]|nr:hypothetical protein AAVH_20285 [Aphelenchus avenae]